MATLDQQSVWITGCAGFLGNRIAKRLLNTGSRVIGLSRRKSSNVDKSIEIDLAAPNARRRLRELVSEIGAPNVVIHAAAKQPGAGSVAEFVGSNVQTTQNLIEGLAGNLPRHFVYTSTQSVYTRPVLLPVKESDNAGGTLPYSATKRWSEQLLEFLKDKCEVTVFRLPSLYGAGQADSFIDGLAKTAQAGEPIELFSRGELFRDALHVSEVVEAIASRIKQPANTGFTIANLGCGRAITTFEYAEALVKALDSSSKIVKSERQASNPSLYGDISRAVQMINFAPKTLVASLNEYANELRTQS